MSDWLDELQEAADWARDQWEALGPTAQDRISQIVAQILDPNFYIDLALEEIQARYTQLEERLRLYSTHPERLVREFADYILPGTRYGEIAQQFRPGSEPLQGYGEEISRPVILIPGMVGTRLMRPGGPVASASEDLPPASLSAWMETQFRTGRSILLRDLPQPIRQALQPVLTRISDRYLYNPRVVWDPDSPYNMIDLMNKTAMERGVLFCPEDTPAQPATDFATLVAESMTLLGFLGLWYGPTHSRIYGEILHALGMSPDQVLLADRRFEALRQRRRLRGWCHPVWNISKDWLLPLERTFNEVIYAFGYDWRQPLYISVNQLVGKIERVKRFHHGKSPILVTHSYGGLLARAAAQLRPQNVAGIVQVFSPTAGSIKMFTNFKKGGGGPIPPAWDLEQPPHQTQLESYFNFDILSTLGGFDVFEVAFGLFLGWDSTEFAATSSGTYGIYSLLPNNMQQPTWLNIENDSRLEGEVARSRNIYDLYRQFDRPWGLLDDRIWNSRGPVSIGDTSERVWQWLAAREGEYGSFVRLLHALRSAGLLRIFERETLSQTQVERVRARVGHGIEWAEQLNERVGNYLHPNTWSIYGSGLDTDVGFNIRHTGTASEPFATHRIIGQDGDGSLQVSSARALSSRFRGETHLRGVKHASAMSESQVARHALVKSVYQAMMAAYRADQRASR
ncbi:MAG: alpha/beta hydrolase [Anaerolineales bacterium]|nr:alpha/beta hydrolase [Anaerolineales bacterium]